MLATLSHVASPDAANTTYLWVYIVLALVTLIGMGFGVAKWLKRQGATEAAVKQMLAMNESLRKLVDANVLARLSEQDSVLADIKLATRPNGLDTDLIGDIVKRSEIKLERVERKQDELASKLDQHIGASTAQVNELWVAVRRKADKA